MAFVRRIGSAYYLVHNVRRRGKVKQMHLAPLGDTPRITDDVVRKVSRHHPFLHIDWARLREKINSRVELFDPGSTHSQKLLHALRNLNLDLAELTPPLLDLTRDPRAGQEMVLQLRLLRSTVDVKLGQFEHAGGPGWHRGFR